MQIYYFLFYDVTMTKMLSNYLKITEKQQNQNNKYRHSNNICLYTFFLIFSTQNALILLYKIL